MFFRKNDPAAVLCKELALVQKREEKMEHTAYSAKSPDWKAELEKRIPQKIYTGLEKAFCKAFCLVFQYGNGVIEKTYNKEDILVNHAIRDYAVQHKGGVKELRQMHKTAKQSDFLNLAITTVEGVGLGALGIGMPDIVLFLATLLKGIYETALNYGYDYGSKQEQLLILKMMETALTSGKARTQKNAEVEEMLLAEPIEITDKCFEDQKKATSSAFAMDMLLLKFIQGLPVVGIIGGAANPVYYRKIIQHVDLKYRKRYLLMQKRRMFSAKESFSFDKQCLAQT